MHKSQTGYLQARAALERARAAHRAARNASGLAARMTEAYSEGDESAQVAAELEDIQSEKLHKIPALREELTAAENAMLAWWAAEIRQVASAAERETLDDLFTRAKRLVTAREKLIDLAARYAGNRPRKHRTAKF